MMGQGLWSLVLLVGMSVHGRAERLLVSSGGGLHSEYKVISRSSFNPQYLAQTARQFVKANVSKQFAQMYLVTDSKHIESLLGTGTTETDLQWMLEKRNRYGRFPVARIVSMRQNAVLQMRDSDGAYKLEVLSGTNPLEFVHFRNAYTIAWLLVAPATKQQTLQLNETMSLGVYIVAKHVPTAETAVLLWKHLTTVFGLRNLSISIRSSAFFITPTFPLNFPFTSVEQTPESEATYLGQPEVSCYLDNGKAGCFASNGTRSYRNLQ